MSRGIMPNYVSKLLTVLGEEQKHAPSPPIPLSLAPQLIEPLSERELEVLRLMAAGMTNQEIAETLVVALGTAKAHTASIYAKLEVHNRTQAVARARELNLL
jgi:LuxR family maltose regulon positive regulatory protein